MSKNAPPKTAYGGLPICCCTSFMTFTMPAEQATTCVRLSFALCMHHIQHVVTLLLSLESDRMHNCTHCCIEWWMAESKCRCEPSSGGKGMVAAG